MNVGDVITCASRAYRVLRIERVGSDGCRVQLEDVENGQQVWVALEGSKRHVLFVFGR